MGIAGWSWATGHPRAHPYARGVRKRERPAPLARGRPYDVAQPNG